MLLSLYEVHVVKSFEHGLLIKQDIAGEELYLRYDKGKTFFDYAITHVIGGECIVHPVDGVYYDITFEVSSTYWSKGRKYFTNATLITIVLS